MIFGGAFIVHQLCIFWRFNFIVQGNFGQGIQGKIFEKSKIIESMLGAFYLLGKKPIFIKTELSHGMILCQTSVPRPKLDFSHQRKTMPRHSFCLFY